MRLKATALSPIPPETVLLAQKIFETDNIYMRLRDYFETFYVDLDFASLYPNCGQPGTDSGELLM